MRDFYSLTKIKIVVHDSNFNRILAVPRHECDFCAMLRNNPEGLKKCDECTEKGIKDCYEKDAINIYKCHAGLIEAAAPIKINGIVAGYMMFGQIMENQEKDLNREEITEYARIFTGKDTNEAYKKLRTKSYGQIRSAAKIMESCICYLLMSDIIKEDSGNIAFSINNYINENLSADLSVDTLCDKFSLSRNMLYKISKNYFNMSIAKYVKQRRIAKAKELIAKGESVTSAAELTGFCEYGYFSRVFKEETGIPPKKFRDMNTR